MEAKKWEELGIKDDFLFGKVMQEPEICKRMLEIILDIKIERIDYPERQKMIDLARDAKGVRLDVYVKDQEEVIYNIEMQPVKRDNVPKRSRYYQGMIDLNILEKGVHYSELNNSYVIFICDFDLFKCGRHIYTFTNICEQDEHIRLDDGTTKIFLNTEGTADDVSPELKAFLQYVGSGKVADDGFVRDLDEAVSRVRENRKWRREYMVMNLWQQDIEREAQRKGLSEGRAEGEMLAIISLVRKKAAKHFSAEDIADMVERDVKTVTDILDCICQYPDDGDEKIYERLFAGNQS